MSVTRVRAITYVTAVSTHVRAITYVTAVSTHVRAITYVTAMQGRSTKIKTGQAIDDVSQTRGGGGGWGHAPPGKFLKFRCSVSTFGAILGPATLQ